jgi:putative NADH-flavin reductase
MKILVLGANGPTGRLLTDRAVDAGHAVTALTRHPDQFPLSAENLRVVQGDVRDPDAVDDVVTGQDVVLSALGVPYSFSHIDLYSTSAANVLAAMGRHDVRRIAVVSSSATDPADRGHPTGGGWFFDHVLAPTITHTIGRQLYADMLRMEHLLRASDTDWTIVRPSGLFVTEDVTPYITGERHVRGRFTSRTDLADFLLRLATEGLFVRQVAAIATVEQTPTVLQLMRQEAVSGGRN